MIEFSFVTQFYIMARKKSTPKRRPVKTAVLVVRKRKATPLKRAKKRARLEVGVARAPKLGFKTRIVGLQDTVTLSSRVLYSSTITDIAYGTAIDQRQRDTVLVKGFKIWFHVKVPQGVTIPRVLRIAVISAKNNTIASSNFLKGYGNDNGLDFQDTRNGIEMTKSQINPREYVTLWQTKIMLPPGNQNATAAPYDKHNGVHMISKYVPLNRVLMWDSSLSIEPDSDRCYMVYWLDDPLAPPGTAPAVDQLLMSNQVVTYFIDNN